MKKGPQTEEGLRQYIEELETRIDEMKTLIGSFKKEMPGCLSVTEAVRENEQKFQAIFEHSPLAIMYTDENGCITTCNENACKLFGAPRDKLIGFSYKSIKDKNMKAAIATALSGERSCFEGEYLTVTGNRQTNMKANFSPAFYSDGTVSGVIGIFEDISDWKKAREEKEKLIRELREALSEVKKLSGLLPICVSCKKIRDDKGYWNQIESYIRERSEIDFSHSLCPECAERLYPDLKPSH